MNKYVVTMNAPPKYGMTENGRHSQISAAARWGATYIELTSSDVEGYAGKIHYDKKLPNGRICWMDNDVMIRSDCPSPFDVVPAGKIGLVRAHHPSHGGATPIVQEKLPPWLKKVGVHGPQDIEKEYCNTGFYTFDLPYHRPIFEKAREIAQNHWVESWWIADQGMMYAAMKLLDFERCYIPPMFQHNGADLWYGWTPTMNKLGFHFCGPIDQWIAGNKTVWDDLGPQRLSPGGTARWEAGRPVAFLDGKELPYYLREVCNCLWHGRAVEIGVCWGGLTWYGAQIARDNYSSWVSVDPWEGGSSDLPNGWNWQDIYEGFQLNMKDSGLDDFVEVKRMRSVEAAKTEEDGSLDLVFIDGDHKYECVKEDIEAWWPKLKQGGVMLGHDYSVGLPGVIQAVDERFGKPEELSEGYYPIWKVTKR